MTNNKEEEWERKFDDNFGMFYYPGIGGRSFDEAHIKSFIKSERENVRRETIKKILEKIPIVVPIAREISLEYAQGQNFAYQKIRDLLTNLDTLNHEDH